MSVFVQVLLLLTLHVLGCYLFPISARSGSRGFQGIPIHFSCGDHR